MDDRRREELVRRFGIAGLCLYAHRACEELLDEVIGSRGLSTLSESRRVWTTADLLGRFADVHHCDACGLPFHEVDEGYVSVMTTTAEEVAALRHVQDGSPPPSPPQAVLRVDPDLFDAVEFGSYDYAWGLLNNPSLDINARDGRGLTLLMLAAMHGFAAISQLLLIHGADPSLADPQGRMPLQIAQEGGHADVVEMLKTETTGQPPGSG